jgi:hypothetical protein
MNFWLRFEKAETLNFLSVATMDCARYPPAPSHILAIFSAIFIVCSSSHSHAKKLYKTA